MSYMMTIGATPEVIKIVEDQKLPIKPLLWYNQNDAVVAMMKKNDLNEAAIEEEYKKLLSMIEKRKIFEQEVLIMSSKPRKL